MKRPAFAGAVVRVLFGLALPFLTVTSSMGAVTVDSSSSASVTDQTSLSWQHTVGAGSDRALIVGLSFDGGPPGPISVTYSGSPLNLIGSLNAGSGAAHVQLWELIPPPVGTGNVVVTLSSVKDFVGGAVSFFGVDPTVPYVTWSAGDGQGSPISNNRSTAMGEMVVQTVAVDRGPALTVGAANTEQWNTGPASVVAGAGSTTPGTGGSVNLSWTFSGNYKWVQINVNLRPTGSSTYEVNSTGDAIDLTPGDDVCDTGGTNAVGASECTLRAAIEEANSSTDPKLIHFDIPTLDPGYNGTGNGEYTIRPGSALPGVSEQLWLDGTTQPGYSGTPIIELDGTNAGVGAHGINLTHTDSTVRGLVINRFDDAGLRMGNARSTLEGSYIGLDVSGSIPRGNGGSGVSIPLVGGCTVGGTAPGAGNVISANGADGISLGSGSTATIQGNIIGLDAGGSVDLGNGDSGIKLWGRDSLVGGTVEAARNIVSGNGYSGIFVEGDDNVIQGNYIGTDITGTIAKGNTGQGILVIDPTDRLRIGGTEAGARNIISGNTADGIQNTGYDAIIENNFIGVDVTGAAPLPNGLFGIRINRVTGATIGGTTVGTENIIAYNGSHGIMVSQAGVNDNHFLRNRIFANQGLGIDLNFDGVTENDVGDADAGPNDLLNFPVITSQTEYGGTVSVSFDLDVPAGDYRIEFFKNPSGGDASGNGEGEAFASAATVTHTGSGVESFAYAFSGSTGDVLTATATECVDAGTCSTFGSTSEFSDASVVVAGTPGLQVVNSGGDSTDATPGDGSCDTGGTNSAGAPECTLRAAIEEANAMIGADEIRFEIPATDAGYQNLGAGLSYWRIQPGSALPGVSGGATTIDGRTQTTYAIGQGYAVNDNGPEVEIRGTVAGAADGLLLTSAGNTVRDLVINGFGQAGMAGVKISGGPATDNSVIGCYLGTNSAGTAALENNRGVAVIGGARANTIGGSDPGDGNLLSGNNVGAYLADSGTDQNQLAGNLVGTAAGGTAAVANNIGVVLDNGAQSNTIGGTTAGERNVVSGNTTFGVRLLAAGTSFNTIAGNYIGIDANGTAKLGNSSGVYFNAADANTVGGTTVGHRNVISGNGRGITFSNSANSNVVQGNYIGTDPGGTGDLGNTFEGVNIVGPALSNVIGGTAAGEGNVIAFNGMDGVWLSGDDADNNRISGNSIFSNVELGIDLDPDGVGTGGGANDDKTTPTLDTLTPSGADFVVRVSTGTGDVVELFRVNNAAAPAVGADPSGSGEGFLFLGSCQDNGACSGPHLAAAADAHGSDGIVQATVLSSGLSNGDFLTATATDASDNTSEFAANVQAAGAAPGITGTVFEDADFAGTASDWDTGVTDLGLPDVDVELYDASDDSWVDSVTTGAGGVFTFAGVPDGTYKVRVRSETIGDADTPPAGGLNATVPATWPYPLAEMTWGNGAALYGGQGATVDDTTIGDDLGPGDTWIAVTVSGAHVFDVNFGFTYNLIVNTSDDGLADSARSAQGSLRQFIKNSNAIVDRQTSYFHVPTSDPGYGATPLRYTIGSVQALPTLADPATLTGATQPDFGGTPVIEIDGGLAGADVDGLRISSAGTEVRGLAIGGFTADGIQILSGGTGATVHGNYIGLRPGGTTLAGNGVYGIDVDADLVTVGSAAAGDRNLIADSGDSGIYITSADNVTIQGNWIGIDASGIIAAGNGRDAVTVSLSDSALVGGANPGDGNVLSGSPWRGALLISATNALVQGNIVGLGADGTTPIPNGRGVEIGGGSGNLIGGTTDGARNVISGNTAGIRIENALTEATITGNYVGTDVAGASGVPNSTGIEILNGTSLQVGGTAAGSRNVIAGNSGDGVMILGGADVVLEGNVIGVNAVGGTLANTGDGVDIGIGGVRIGGDTAAAANHIANNGGRGVTVRPAAITGITILQNSVHANGSLGIDLGSDGFTANDGGDPDPGPNDLLNFPVLTAVVQNGADLDIDFDLDVPAGNYRIEFFDNPGGNDPSGNGEGETYIGFAGITHTGSGVESFSTTISGVTPTGDVTSTTTEDLGAGNHGSTSEFSESMSPATTVTVSGVVFEDVNYGGGVGVDYATALTRAGPFTIERSGVTVELYDSTGDHVAAVSPQTTALDGSYSFTDLTPGSYTVRVVNGTVTSTRTGSDGSELGVQTYRIDGDGEPVDAGANKVGGEVPVDENAAANSGAQTLASLQGTDLDTDGIAEWTQSIVTVDASGGNVTGVDFGFNFDTIVNTNDQDQGSLRQFIVNTNLLTDNASLAQDGLTAGVETSLFMIPSDVDPLSRSKDPNFDAARGVAVITPVIGLPAVTSGGTSIDGATQTSSIGNTNPVNLGYVGPVGLGPDALPGTADDPTLAGVAGPEVEIRGNSTIAYGLQLTASDIVVRGTAIFGFGSSGLDANISVSGAGNTGCIIELNVLGTPADSFTDPGAQRSDFINVKIQSAGDGFVRNNLLGYVGREYVRIVSALNWQINDNEMRGGGLGGTFGGVTVIQNSTGELRRNLITENAAASAILAVNAAVLIEDNTLSANPGSGVAFFENPGELRGSAQILQNDIHDNGSAGITAYGQNGAALSSIHIRVSQNRFSANGGISIDLMPDWAATGITVNDGTLLGDGSAGNPCGIVSSSGNEGLDFPIIDSATIDGGTSTIVGRACPNSDVEVYLAAPDGDLSDTLAGIDYGEGPRFLGSVVADAGTGAFTLAGVPGLSAGDDLSAISIDGSDNTSEFAANVALVVAGSNITGTVYHDVNVNDALDPGELGIGAVWVKLLDSGGSVIQVVPADFDTGAYVLTSVADGDYTVIVDDNNLVADNTPTSPVNWLFQNPAGGSLAVTVAGVDVSGRDFGLTFEFDLAADCSCGYEDGLFTQTSITIDGDMSDWALILPDGDNNACDATDDTDLDHPVQSTGRNMLRTAVTHDASYFSMWTQRVGSSSNTQNFIYYADTSNDGILQAGEPVIVARWQGNTGTVTLERHAYDDLGSGGDPLLDASGFADGYSMLGDLTFVKTLTMPDGSGQGSTTGATDGTQMEWKISWAELGVAPGAAIAWHIGSTNADPGSAGLGAQIDDNLGGCGGQCTGSNQFAGVVGTPISGGTGQTVYSAHVFTNTGNGDDRFDLTWTSTGDFVPVSVTFYEDLGTVGQYDPGVDVLLTDTDGDAVSDTGVMASGASFDLLIAIELPGPGTIGSATVTTTATSNFVPGCGGTVVPVSGSVDDPVQIVPSLIKRAFESDGTPIANGTTVPQGAPVKFLIYVDNSGAVLSDVSVQDVLDAGFSYRAGSLKVSNALQSSVVCPAGICDEAAIFASVNGQGASTDGVDGDVVSYTGASTTIDVGDAQQANASLNIAADSIWALLFTVTMQ